MSDALLTYLDAMKRFSTLADLVYAELQSPADWDAANLFSSSVQPYLEEAREEARSLVVGQEVRLGLGAGSDPFRLDYGMHRWLRDQCEPAYSDWLQWLVQAIGRREWVLDLLGVPPDSPIVNAATPMVSAALREVPIWHPGDDSLVGYLDLDLWLGDTARIVIELKTFNRGFEKQLRYREALDAKGIEADFVLLTRDYADAETVFGFRTRVLV